MKNFKSFHDGSIVFGNFSLLIGANASGKSNIREALRFLHGVGRGYAFAEILGEKWGDGGQLIWDGLRGGARRVARHGCGSFRVEISFQAPETSARPESSDRVRNYRYEIEVSVTSGEARLQSEALFVDNSYVFNTHPDGLARGSMEGTFIKARCKSGAGMPPDGTFVLDRPILGQFPNNAAARAQSRRSVAAASRALTNIHFLDLDPEAARRSSPRGLVVLGDRGQNLSSVLEDLCSEDARKEVLLSWVRALTPMDAVDLTFEHDLDNRTMAILEESSGLLTPLSTASDGTVRFLAMVASVLGASSHETLFFEELENGIHPHRVNLLLELIKEGGLRGGPQVIATSHSPQLLMHALESEDTVSSLIARSEAGISLVFDLNKNEPFSEVLQSQDPVDLMSSGWMEDTAVYLADEEEAF